METVRRSAPSGRTKTTRERSSTLPDKTVAAAVPVTDAKQQSPGQEFEQPSTSTGATQCNPNATPVPARASHGPWLWLALLGLGLLSAFNAWNAYRLTKLPIIELRMVTPGDET